MDNMNTKAFTLIELLIVMMIIAILAVAVVPKVGGMARTARLNATKKEMKELQYALLGNPRKNIVGYLDNMGHLPTGDSTGNVGSGGENGLVALYIDPSGGAGFNKYTQMGWNGPYVDSSDDDNNGVPDILEDAWGNGYVYDASAATITSYGSDGVSGGSGFDEDIVLNLQ